MDYIDSKNVKRISRDNKLKYRKSNSNSDVLNELSKIMNELNSHFSESIIEKTANWMIYNNLWLKNENLGLNNRFYNYGRGDVILSIDFGTVNIGTEIRYPHPCVVLYDNGEDWVIVAPITASQLDENNNPIVHKPFEILINAQKNKPKNPREFHFKKDSVIQVDQIQRISKHRAINKTSLKIRTDLLNQIDNVILENYTPQKHKLLEKMKELNNELMTNVKNRDEEISKLKNEKALLEEENKKYKEMLNQMKVI